MKTVELAHQVKVPACKLSLLSGPAVCLEKKAAAGEMAQRAGARLRPDGSSRPSVIPDPGYWVPSSGQGRRCTDIHAG